jgi:hypothetical protein
VEGEVEPRTDQQLTPDGPLEEDTTSLPYAGRWLSLYRGRTVMLASVSAVLARAGVVVIGGVLGVSTGETPTTMTRRRSDWSER